MKNINLTTLKKRVLERYNEKKEREKQEKEVQEKLLKIRKKRLAEENISLEIKDISKNATDVSQNATDVSQNATDVSQNATGVSQNATDVTQNATDVTQNATDVTQNTTSQNATDVSQNFIISNKLPYLLIDYNDKNIDFASEYGYNTLLIDKKKGISNIDEIKNNKYIIINFWRTLTKSNLNNISYDCSGVDYKKFVNLFEKKYKWGIKEKPSDDLTKEEINKYELIYDNVHEILKKIYNDGKKIFIISNAHCSFIQNILKYYKIDKFVEKVIAPSMCGVPYVYNDGTETIKDSRKINIERFFIYIERYIGRLAR